MNYAYLHRNIRMLKNGFGRMTRKHTPSFVYSYKFVFVVRIFVPYSYFVDMNYTIKKITSAEEMLGSFDLIRELSPDVSPEAYKKMLEEMVPHNYFQVGVFDGKELLAVSGYWIATKIYSGKYLEIDNFVVAAKYRSKNIGKMLVDWMLEEARRQACKTVLLDAYVENFKAHRFYYRHGFIARGFHYIKHL